MKTRVLFVCLGNICRSPLAEGVFRHIVESHGRGDDFEIDSAGTGGWHAGDLPDARARDVAHRNGVSLEGQRARKFSREDFDRFDHVLAMDAQNLADLERLCPPSRRESLRLLRDLDPNGPGDVPDPYYGGRGGFDEVFALLERCCGALFEELTRT